MIKKSIYRSSLYHMRHFFSTFFYLNLREILHEGMKKLVCSEDTLKIKIENYYAAKEKFKKNRS